MALERRAFDLERGLALARLHQRAERSAVPPWDYERSLRASALETLDTLRSHGRILPGAGHRVAVRAARRLTAALPSLRRQLLEEGSLGPVVIHGDVHSGNVIVRNVRGAHSVALLDWARCRIGSPLEDLSSWLLSLRPWEPGARRRHDSLLMHYLLNAGAVGGLTPEVRRMYWIAAASNAMSGALRYHLAVATDDRLGAPRREAAVRRAQDWIRVLVRADAYA